MKPLKLNLWGYFLPRKTWHFLGLSAFVAISTLSCQASSHYKPGKTCEITFRDYRNNLNLSLRNESLSPRAKLYSASQDTNTTVKVISDDLMEVLVNRLQDLGFFENAHSGSIPSQAIGGATNALSVKVESESKFLFRNNGSSPKIQNAMIQMVQSFREIYDGTFQAKSIDQSGDYFKEQQKKLEESKKREGAKP